MESPKSPSRLISQQQAVDRNEEQRHGAADATAARSVTSLSPLAAGRTVPWTPVAVAWEARRRGGGEIEKNIQSRKNNQEQNQIENRHNQEQKSKGLRVLLVAAVVASGSSRVRRPDESPGEDELAAAPRPWMTAGASPIASAAKIEGEEVPTSHRSRRHRPPHRSHLATRGSSGRRREAWSGDVPHGGTGGGGGVEVRGGIPYLHSSTTPGEGEEGGATSPMAARSTGRRGGAGGEEKEAQRHRREEEEEGLRGDVSRRRASHRRRGCIPLP
uniref:DUF834 domain-containing protein n=1 Tax=Oryza meridionalis TaxID=40149 RepID=A0A0E0E3X1_9ORYZ